MEMLKYRTSVVFSIYVS